MTYNSGHSKQEARKLMKNFLSEEGKVTLEKFKSEAFFNFSLGKSQPQKLVKMMKAAGDIEIIEETEQVGDVEEVVKYVKLGSEALENGER